MFYLMPLMARMMGQAIFHPRPRVVTKTVVVYNTQPKPKVAEKSVEQLQEEREHAREVEARKLADAINVDYLD